MQIQRRKSFLYYIMMALSILAVCGGCAATMSATGANTGVYSYIRGELKRTYALTYEESINACKASLAYLKMPLEEFHQKGVTTVIKARRSDGHSLGRQPFAWREKRCLLFSSPSFLAW